MGAEEPSELALPCCSRMVSAAVGGWVLGSSSSSLWGIAEPQGKSWGFSPSTFRCTGPGNVPHLPAASSGFLKGFPLSDTAGSARWVSCRFDSPSATSAVFIIAEVSPRRRLPPSVCQRWAQEPARQRAASRRDNSYRVRCWLSSAFPHVVTISACHRSPRVVRFLRFSLQRQTLGKLILLPRRFSPFLPCLALNISCANFVLYVALGCCLVGERRWAGKRPRVEKRSLTIPWDRSSTTLLNLRCCLHCGWSSVVGLGLSCRPRTGFIEEQALCRFNLPKSGVWKSGTKWRKEEREMQKKRSCAWEVWLKHKRLHFGPMLACVLAVQFVSFL